MDELTESALRWQQQLDQDEAWILEALKNFKPKPEDWLEISSMEIEPKWRFYATLGLIYHRKLEIAEILKQVGDSD